MNLSRQQGLEFLETVWDFYARAGRDSLPWRSPEPDGSFNPYKIMVSELMLQQTQVARVIPKYPDFLGQFPSSQALAQAELGAVLRSWQGLGYNRRAKFLWQAAQAVEARGTFPRELAGLVTLPGIGPNTAGAILAYAYNEPVVFIETNVRTVYIHHFFADSSGVDDAAIRLLVEQTLDREHSREFYWALMDYGSYLKATAGNVSSASKHYAKQSTFQGSRRQIRGQVLRSLHEGDLNLADIQAAIPDTRLESVLNDLLAEGLIRLEASEYRL